VNEQRLTKTRLFENYFSRDELLVACILLSLSPENAELSLKFNSSFESSGWVDDSCRGDLSVSLEMSMPPPLSSSSSAVQTCFCLSSIFAGRVYSLLYSLAHKISFVKVLAMDFKTLLSRLQMTTAKTIMIAEARAALTTPTITHTI